MWCWCDVMRRNGECGFDTSPSSLTLRAQARAVSCNDSNCPAAECLCSTSSSASCTCSYGVEKQNNENKNNNKHIGIYRRIHYIILNYISQMYIYIYIIEHNHTINTCTFAVSSFDPVFFLLLFTSGLASCDWILRFLVLEALSPTLHCALPFSSAIRPGWAVKLSHLWRK